MMKRLLVTWIVWGSLGACSGENPHEKAIAGAIESMVIAMEQDDPEGFKDGLHLDYRDRFGHDRNTVTDRLFLIVSEMNQLDIQIVGLTFEELDPDYGFARVFFKVKLEGDGRPRGYAWQEIKRRNIVLHLRRVGDHWKGIKGDLGIDLMGALLQ